MSEKYDFSGYATKNDVRCADGRTIRKDAFKDCDGMIVPIVWMHQHDSPFNVLGHALLENRDDGVYAYGKFNNSDEGKAVKTRVDNGDLKSLSIYANNLKQHGGDVVHGVIREVSVVLAGANPEATIEFVDLAHGDDGELTEAVIMMPEQNLIGDKALAHADGKSETGGDKMANNKRTVQEVLDSMNEEQRMVSNFLIDRAFEEGAKAADDTEEDENEDKNDKEETSMKHNVFEGDTPQNSLSHADFQKIMVDAKRLGSMKAAVAEHIENGVLSHAVYNHDASGNEAAEQTYGIADINYLFPDARTINNTPDFIQRERTWVDDVMGGVHHTPFSRIKSIHANITMDEARARGYLKGNMKREEVFSLLKRTTEPHTVYKKQKMDRDDTIDITDFDVIAWLKQEMRWMLDEELARAFLIGDGRLASDDDHIDENHIRPIWTDADLYAVKKDVAAGDDESTTAKNFIRAAIKARKDYKGSGNPTLFCTEDLLTDMLLLEDGIGHLLYQSEAQLATTLRVRKIVTVPVMENLTDANGKELLGIIVNLTDYNVGADKGGAVEMFDDFDIDYNQMKYLIETRCSGALTKPYSALVFSKVNNVADN